jgi:protein required for attachment to host cells
MHTVWVLVCDSARARFFEVRGGDSGWDLASEVSHEGSRSKASALIGDRAGSRSSEGASVHHNALAPAASPKDVEKGHFAHQLGKTLDEGLRSGRFRRWVLVAPPHFAGLVTKELTPELKKHLLATVEKEMSRTDPRALAEALRDTVRIPLDEQDVTAPSVKRAH